MRTVTLTEGDHGRTVSVRCDDVLEVRLQENPTTGFRWTVERIDGDGVTLLGEDFSSPPARVGVAGRAGIRIFRFVAGTPGNARVKLKRWREWEGEDSVAARFEVTVSVRG